MIKDITIGQYIPGESPVHHLDPRLKILISIIFIIDLFVINNFKGYIFVFVFILSCILIAGIKLKYIFKGLKPILLLILITAVFNLFLTPGKEQIFTYGKITIYKEGFYLASFMVIRLIFLITGTSILTLTTSPIELTDGLESLLNPFKKIGLPAHELAMMMTIALRFIPTLMDETDKIMKAQMARGASFDEGNLVKRAKALIPILVPLFISSFRRADELAMAMESRCYRGGEGRTRMKILRYTAGDLIAAFIFIVYASLTIWSRWL
ncbi:MAG: energy-coupling factor transporter transmembrane protein EcfT [Bacillota bacterium]|nr:energy-coupling factor transporter transmembrane protein EcfT [Bacillota bacterium]